MSDFSPKRSVEAELFTFEFAPLLDTGATIVSASWSIAAVEGVDPDAANMLIDSPVITGSQVCQMIAGGVPGVRYRPICTACTSDGQTLVLPEHGYGLLLVTA
jgi:hypothetical protein